MAAFQPAQRRLDDGADIDDWMAQRNADLQQLGPDATLAGREAWAQSTRTGENLSAVRPGDVAAIGAQALSQNASPMEKDSDSAGGAAETPLALRTVEPAISPIEAPDIDNLTSLTPAFRSANRFSIARDGDSISGLLGSSNPGEIGKFLTVNGLDRRNSRLFVGQNYAIPDPSEEASPDQVAAGQQLLQADSARLADARGRQTSAQANSNGTSVPPVASTASSAPNPVGTIQYGALWAAAPSDQELAELRRQQAAFSRTTRQIDIQDSWLGMPVFAPLLALGLGEAGALAADALGPEVESAPLEFKQSDPYPRVGDNWATRAGRRAHAALREQVEQKPGWQSEPNVKLPDGQLVKPDVRTPPRIRNRGEEPKPFQMELKPNTPSGRRAGAKAVQKYKDLTNLRTRLILYDPKPFI